MISETQKILSMKEQFQSQQDVINQSLQDLVNKIQTISSSTPSPPFPVVTVPVIASNEHASSLPSAVDDEKDDETHKQQASSNESKIMKPEEETKINNKHNGQVERKEALPVEESEAEEDTIARPKLLPTTSPMRFPFSSSPSSISIVPSQWQQHQYAIMVQEKERLEAAISHFPIPFDNNQSSNTYEDDENEREKLRATTAKNIQNSNRKFRPASAPRTSSSSTSFHHQAHPMNYPVSSVTTLPSQSSQTSNRQALASIVGIYPEMLSPEMTKLLVAQIARRSLTEEELAMTMHSNTVAPGTSPARHTTHHNQHQHRHKSPSYIGGSARSSSNLRTQQQPQQLLQQQQQPRRYAVSQSLMSSTTSSTAPSNSMKRNHHSHNSNHLYLQQPPQKEDFNQLHHIPPSQQRERYNNQHF